MQLKQQEVIWRGPASSDCFISELHQQLFGIIQTPGKDAGEFFLFSFPLTERIIELGKGRTTRGTGGNGSSIDKPKRLVCRNIVKILIEKDAI